MNNQLASSNKASESDFLDVCAMVWNRKRTILVVGMLPLIASVLLAFFSSPIYRAEVLLIPANARESNEMASGLSGQLGGLASLTGISLGGENDRKNEAVATIKSRTLTNAFVSDNDLLPVLFSQQWDPKTKDWREAVSKAPTLWDAYKKIDRIRRLDEDKKTGLLKLTVEWTDAELAAQWATDLIKRTNQHLRAQAIERADRNIGFLRRQLNETSVIEMRQALYRLIESELKTAMLAQGSEEYAFRVIDPAVVPEEKIWPKRMLLVILGILSGLFLGVFSALVAATLEARRNALTE